MSEAVKLVSYHPDWPCLYALEATAIRAALEGALVEHVGSTSVPGLMAKPFIDVVAGLEDERGLAASIPSLQSLGYRYMPEAEEVVPERRFFRRLDCSPGYHVHVVARAAPLWSNLRRFRDLLRASPARAEAYLQLKLELAAAHAGDVDAYTAAKGPHIEAALGVAGPTG